MLLLLLLACEGYLIQPYEPEWEQLSVGSYTACAQRADGYVRCASPLKPTADDIVMGARERAANHNMSGVTVGDWLACALQDPEGEGEGRLRCWGDPEDPAWPSEDSPRLKADSLDIGATLVCGLRAGPAAEEQDSAEPTVAGDLWCGGAAGSNELPGNFQQVVVGDDFACTLDSSGSVGCLGALSAFGLTEISALAASGDGLCWRYKRGDVACQLVTDSTPTVITGLLETDKFLALGMAGLCSWSAGEAATCVANPWTGLKLNPGPTRWKRLELSTGLAYACGVTKEGTLKCRGQQGNTPDFSGMGD